MADGRALVLALLIALVAGLALSTPARAEAGVSIAASEVLIDLTGAMTLDEARAASGWRKLGGPRFAAGYGPGALWFRLHLAGARDGIAILSVRPSFLDSVTFYLPAGNTVRDGHADDAGFVAYRQGDLLPAAARVYALRGFAVPVTLSAGAGRDVYLRVETTSTRLVVADLAWADGFMATLMREAMAGGASYLLILVMFAFAGAQYLRTRQPVYASHAALALIIFLFFLARSGDLGLILVTMPQVAHQAVGVSVCLALGGLVLAVAQTLPRRAGLALTAWPGRILAVIVGFSVLLALAGQYERIAGSFALLIALSISYLLLWSVLAPEGFRVLGLARSLALVLFLPTGLINLGLVDLYWLAEAALTLGVLSMLAVVVAMAWRDDGARRKAHAAAVIEAQTARIESGLREQALRLHRQWVSIFSHEIKTPLAIIEASRTNIGRLAPKPEIAERTGKIGRAVEDINGLVNAMLAADELETRIGQAERTRIDLAALLDAALPPGERARIAVTCPAGLVAEADPALLTIAVSNLLSNALQHGRADAPIGLVAEAVGTGGARITVSSLGAELPPGLVPRLYEKHFRSAGSVGHGIGLWAVAAIARHHGGDAAYARTAQGENSFAFWLGGRPA